MEGLGFRKYRFSINLQIDTLQLVAFGVLGAERSISTAETSAGNFNPLRIAAAMSRLAWGTGMHGISCGDSIVLELAERALSRIAR